jgi:hypothetical protein
VNYHDLVSLSFATRERLERRTREADAERLGREIRRTPRRRRVRVTIGLAFGAGRRATQPRLEA